MPTWEVYRAAMVCDPIGVGLMQQLIKIYIPEIKVIVLL